MPFFQIKNKYILISILLALLVLILTYYSKYLFNSIPIHEFEIYNIGNLFNLSVTVLLVLGLFLHLFSKGEISIWNYRLVVLMMGISFVAVAILLVLNLVGFSYPQKYIFYYPFKKLFVGILFMLSGILQIFTVSFLWSSLFSNSRIVFIKALLITGFSVAVLVCFSFYYTTSFLSVEVEEISSLKNAEIGVVLGAAVWHKNQPSPLFKGRIEKVKELYQKRLLKKVQLTGGNAPGEVSEAMAALIYLENSGINSADIFIEEKTSTTSEQILYIKNNLSLKYGDKPIIIISDHFHIKRVMEMCKFYGVKALGVASDYSLNWEKLVYYRVRDSIGLLLFWFFAI